jgi:hypothetical protein
VCTRKLREIIEGERAGSANGSDYYGPVEPRTAERGKNALPEECFTARVLTTKYQVEQHHGKGTLYFPFWNMAIVVQ